MVKKITIPSKKFAIELKHDSILIGKKERTKPVAFDEADSSKITNDPYPVPKELWFLCDLITSLGLHQENLFLQPGLRSEIGQLREWLDTGAH